MTRRPATGAARAALVLLTTAAPFVLAIVLRALPRADLVASGLGWLVPAMAVALLAASAVAAVSGLVAGLRGGALASLLLTGAAAAVAAGCLGLAAGTPSMLLTTATAAAFVSVGAVADRLEVLVHGRAARFALATGAVLVAGAVAMADILPAMASVAGRAGPALVLLGAVLAAAGAIVAAGRPVAVVAGMTAAAAAALWLARGSDVTLVVALLSLLAATLAIVHSLLGADEAGASPGTDVGGLPELAAHVSDGVLRFDGRLQLRAWNPAAARLLVLDEASGGSRLEDLLGVALSELPLEGEPRVSAASAAGLQVGLHRDADGLTVVLRDPGAARDADRLGRELRATIEELLQARRTVELQRAEIERAATFDALTGVASRAAILARLDLEVAESRRYQHPAAVVLLDVDGFGALNAAHGVSAGDALLREVALRIRLRVRAADALGRSGSDGFLAILPHTDEAGAATFADVLRRRVAGRPISLDGTEVSVTISAGVAVIRPGEDLDRDGLLARAGEALSSARGAGGNTVALDRLHGLARLANPQAPRPDTDEPATSNPPDA
jgi:diguanylate cyclase (GGDEF)-like protein